MTLRIAVSVLCIEQELRKGLERLLVARYSCICKATTLSNSRQKVKIRNWSTIRMFIGVIFPNWSDSSSVEIEKKEC